MPEASHGAPLAFPRAPFSTAGSRPPPERLKLRLSPADELVSGRECRVAVPAFSDSTFIANCGDRDTRAAARRRPLTLLRLGLERPGLSWQRGLPKKSMVTQRVLDPQPASCCALVPRHASSRINRCAACGSRSPSGRGKHRRRPGSGLSSFPQRIGRPGLEPRIGRLLTERSHWPPFWGLATPERWRAREL